MGGGIDVIIDLTGTAVLLDLTSEFNECHRGEKKNSKLPKKLTIQWMSKLPKKDPSKKIKVARPLSVRENIAVREISIDAAWFEEAEAAFNVAMPP